ncbi:response regulator [Phenylobacterium sp.]|uniref:response regulator n=1 Tax=Phenylobacterium sp. TaxID=1871053 RepID=UPI0025E1EF2E|nr:response regulator [Phenylobacterium sp.]
MTSLRRMLDGDKLKLEGVHFLLVDDNPHALDIMAQVVLGFGVRNMTKVESAAAARQAIARGGIDIVLTDGQMPEESGYQLTRWIRHEASESMRYVPILIITGHTPQSDVTLGRDLGANFTIAKPLVPRVLLQRLFWLSQEDRQFVLSDTYKGPDRRFKRLGPPSGTDGRREGDLKGEVGEASEPNLSQAQIDALMKPAKVVL